MTEREEMLALAVRNAVEKHCHIDTRWPCSARIDDSHMAEFISDLREALAASPQAPGVIVDCVAKTIWLAEFSRAFSRVPSDPWENQSETHKEGHRDTARKLIAAGYVIPPAARIMEATPAQHAGRAKGEPAQFVRNGKLETCQCLDCREAVATAPPAAGSGALREAVTSYFRLWDCCGGSETIAAEDFAEARQAMRAALSTPSETGRERAEPENWEDDPSSDERWNAGCDFAMLELCSFMGVDPHTASWDAATETVDGDVRAVIGNIIRAKMGEDWSPSDATQPETASSVRDASPQEVQEACAQVADRSAAKLEEKARDLFKQRGEFETRAARDTAYDIAESIRALIPPTESPDHLRLDWLQERVVDTIYLDDGKIIDVRGNNLREAIDGAMRRWPGSLEDEAGDTKVAESTDD